MAQKTTGVRSVLSSPAVYDFVQSVMGAKQNRRRLVDQFIRPFDGMRILDVGCGPAEILEALPKIIDYTGYDISQQYIESAQERFAGRGAFHCRFLKMDEARTLAPYDLIMALGVLHHMGDQDVEELFAIASTLIKPGGRLLTLDCTFIPKQNPIARLLVASDRGQNVRTPEAYTALAGKAFGSVKGTLQHQAWIPYTLWIMELS